MITGASETKEVSLELGNITWSHNIKMNLPAPKKRKTEVIEWEPSELPSFPILLSKKAIGKHARLCVLSHADQGEDKAQGGGVSLVALSAQRWALEARSFGCMEKNRGCLLSV